MERRKFLQNTLITTTGLTLVPVLTKGIPLLFNEQESIKISANAQGKPFEHLWNKCIGGGLAIEGLRATWLDHLQFVKDNCGFENCRISGLFNKDMLVYNKQHGVSVLNWHYIDDLLDRMQDIEIKPFIELQNIDPALNFAEWDCLLTSFINHYIQRYGKEEVCTWHFEVWNEPNQDTWHNSDNNKQLEFYKTTVNSLKKAGPKLKAGAFISAVTNTEEDIKLNDFLTYCNKENLPVDFISATYLNSNRQKFISLNKVLSDNNILTTKIHLINSDPSHTNQDTHTTAASIITANLNCIGLANSLSLINFTDISTKTASLTSTFQRGAGLVNYQGIANPVFHGYKMLKELGDELLYHKDGLIITRSASDKRITALLYPNVTSPKKTVFTLTDLPFNSLFEIETINQDNGNTLDNWKKMGSPEHPTRNQIKKLKDLAMTTKKEKVMANQNGSLNFERELDPWSVILLKQV